MRVHITPSNIARTRWYELVERFAFGGAVTVVAGLLAKYFGPVFGGLFLAFPAIFPAGATLIENHETEKKKKAGIPETIRGRQLASVDAVGASLGSLGLICFGLVVWKLLSAENAVIAIAAATMIWLGVSILFWEIRKSHWWR